MINSVPDVFRAISESDEFFELLAKINRKAYKAHIDAGFTREEALQIVLAHGSMVRMNNNS